MARVLKIEFFLFSVPCVCRRLVFEKNNHKGQNHFPCLTLTNLDINNKNLKLNKLRRSSPRADRR